MIKNKIREEIQNEKCDYSRKLEMGKDYIVYNLKKYLTSKFKDKTHTYFGV